MEVGEGRNGEEQVHQQKKVDNRETGYFRVLDFHSPTHFSFTVVDFSSHPLSVRRSLAKDGGFKYSD